MTLRLRPVGGQALQVVDRCAAPAVDASVVVAHRGELARVACEQLEQLVLDGVGVLADLFHQQVAQRPGQCARTPASRSEQLLQGSTDQVVEVDRLERRLAAPRSAPSHAARRVRRPASTSPLCKPWFFHRLIAHCQRRASALSLLPPASFSTDSTSSLSAMLNCSFRPRRSPSARSKTHAQRVEGADGEVLGRARPDQRLGPLAHLGGSLVGEGDRRDAPARGRPAAAARSCG